MSNGNCSFCGKSHDRVFRLITSDGAQICNECVARCAEMIAEECRKLAREMSVPTPSNGEASA